MARLGGLVVVLLVACAAWWLWSPEEAAPIDPAGPPANEQAADPAAGRVVEPAQGAIQDAAADKIERVAVPSDAPNYTVRGTVLADARSPDLSRIRVLAYAGDPHDTSGILSSAMSPLTNRNSVPSFLLEGDPIADVPVGADGSFELRTAQRHLRITIDHDLYLLASPEIAHVSERTRQLELVLSPMLGGMLRGRLIGERRDDVEQVHLTLEPDPMAIMRDSRAMMAAMLAATRQPATPVADGTFIFRAVSPGASLKLSVSGGRATAQVHEAALQPGEVRDVVVPTTTASMLVVRVVDEAGEAIVGASVVARQGGGGMTGMLRAHHERTDESGTVTFAALHPGDYAIEGTAAGMTTARATTNIVRQVEPTHLQLTLGEGGVVTGVVLDPDGKPLADAHVAHHPGGDIPILGDLAAQLGPAYMKAMATEGAKTDEHGRFRLTGLSDDGEFLLIGAHELYAAGVAREVEMGDTDVVVQLKPYGRLRGKVVAAGSDEPITDFTVSLSRTSFLVMQMPVKNEIVHAEDGTFALPEVAMDSYTLRIEADGYGTLRKSVKVASTDAVDVGTLALHPAARIRGVVRDENGNPIHGALVRKRKGGMADNPMLAMFSGSSVRAYSNAKGEFELGPLPPGRLMLVANAPGFASGRSARLKVASGETLADVVIELGHGGSIKGRIVCGAGQRPDDFLLIAQHQGTQNTHSGDFDVNGDFLIENLDPGAYAVQAMPRQLMETFDGGDWRPGEGLDIGKLMRELTDSVISERCTVRSGEQSEVTLEVADITIGAQWQIHVAIGEQRDCSGVVEAVSLEDGTMRVAMMMEGEATFHRMQAGLHRLQVRSGLTMTPVGKAIELEYPEGKEHHESTLALPGGELRGKVVDAATDEPLRSAIVHLHHDGHGERDDPIGLCLTDADGQFAFTGLADGTYSLVAAQPLAGSENTTSRRSGIALVSGTTNDPIILRAQPAAGAAVVVTDSSGQAVGGATVMCVDDEGRPLGSLGLAATGPDGRAFFGGMPAGPARVVGRAAGRAPGASTILQLDPDQHTEFQLSLPDGAPTRLSVVDDDGNKLRGATVTARFESGPWLPTMLLVQRVQTDGTFDLGRLGPGSWQFRITHPAVGTITHERSISGTAPVTILVTR